MRTTALLTSLAALALACNGNGNGNGNNNDTGDTDSVSYEDGCIDVSSADQGFANIQDAITVAEDGATIELCDDVNVPIVVDKTLTITGNGAILVPPPNDMAVVVVEGGALTLTDVEIQTTRSGVVVEAGASLDADNIDITEVANYGFDIAAGATATINGATIVAPDWGGFRVQGGEATITNADVSDAGSYGVLADSAATVTVTDSRFANIANRDGGTQLWDIDGVGVWVEGGSTVTMSGNTIIGAQISAVSVDGNSSLTLEGDEFIGLGETFTAVAVRQSSLEASGISVSDYAQYGLLALNASTLSLESVSFTVEPEASAPNFVGNPDDPGDDRIGSVGLYVLESELTLSGTAELPSTISGHNGAGVLVSPSGGGDTSGLTMSHTNIDDNGGFGVTVYSGDATFEDVNITNTRNDDAYCVTPTGYRCNMALALWTSDGTLTNTTVTDSNDWGATVVNGFIEINGGTFARNEANSVFGQSSSVTVTDTVFEQGGDEQITVQQGSTLAITGATFRDGDYTRISEFESGDSLIRQVSYYQARDVFASGSEVTIADSTFENGQTGVYVAGQADSPGAATITNTTFAGYNQYPTYASSSPVELVLDQVTFEDIGRYATYCYECEFKASNVTVRDVNTYLYKFEYFTDGELLFDNEFEQADPAFYFLRGDVALEDVTIENTRAGAILARDTTLEMDGVTVRDAVNGEFEAAAVDVQWSSTDYVPNAVLNELTIEGPVGFTPEDSDTVVEVDALRIDGWTDTTTGEQGDGVVEIINLSIGADESGRGITGAGLRATDLGTLSLTGLDINTTGGAGMILNQVSGEITGAAAGRTGIIEGAGTYLVDPEAPIADGISIDADRGTWDDSTLTLTGITINDAAVDGISANAGSMTWTDLTVSGAGSYGATCTDVTFATCTATLDGALGATDGCDACIVDE